MHIENRRSRSLMPRRFVTSRDPAVVQATRDAAAVLRRRQSTGGGPLFTSARDAVRWYVETRGRVGTPHGLHPRTELVSAATGERARVSVDGGRGGDLDGTLATLRTIAEAVEAARAEEPVGTAGLLEWLGGMTQAAVATKHRIAQQTLSDKIGRAERVIARVLSDEATSLLQ